MTTFALLTLCCGILYRHLLILRDKYISPAHETTAKRFLVGFLLAGPFMFFTCGLLTFLCTIRDTWPIKRCMEAQAISPFWRALVLR